jgi:DNA invertase Pin-like site-specific DNA recombinase
VWAASRSALAGVGRSRTNFEDNDRSAYSGKRRLAYEQMLTAVEKRGLDAIVTWHNDRLHRSPRELEAFIDLVERRGIRVAWSAAATTT